MGTKETSEDLMSKVKPVVVRNTNELAAALGVSPADALDLEIRSQLNDKIIDTVKTSGMTHAQVAKTVGCPARASPRC
jgi:hypothetical protein